EVRVFGMEVVHCAMFTEERVLQDGPATGFVVIEFLVRAPGLSPEQFAQQWQAHAGALLDSAPARRLVRRYAQDRVVQQPPPGYEFDGVSEMWFDSMEDAVALLGDADYQAGVQAARAAFCDMDRTVLMPTRVTHAWAA
ncbi:MAG: EthD family reductase, partial [Rubrivivax sp.]